jgi:ferritin-like metal-binding protein YciE
MADVQSLRSHLLMELRDLLDAEQQLTKVLPVLASAAATPALRRAFQDHLRETEGHTTRLKRAFEALGEPAQPKHCQAMEGLVREANALMTATPPGALRDTVMITSAQKVEHYEMASYGTARTYAQVLGEPEVARLLQETLDEEKAADAKLTAIAEGGINKKAAEESLPDQSPAGVIEHTAAFAGQAVGIGARALERAAGAIGLGKRPSDVVAPARSAKARVAAVAHEKAEPRKRGTASTKRATHKAASSTKRRRSRPGNRAAKGR